MSKLALPFSIWETFFVYKGRYAIRAEDVGFDALEREEELMDDRLASAEHARLVDVSCKNCGASYQAALGYTDRCPYGGTHFDVK